MDRRSFNKTLLLSGLAAPSILAGAAPSALAKEGGALRQFGLDPFGRVRLRLAGATAPIRWFIILTDDAVFGVDLRGTVPQMAADRLDLSRFPLIGQILEPTLRNRFASAGTVGSLYLIDNVIVLLPLTALTPLHHRIWITHHKVVYRPPAKAKKLRLKTPMTAQQVRSGRLIGKAVLQNDVILGIVPPSVLDDIEFAPAGPA